MPKRSCAFRFNQKTPLLLHVVCGKRMKNLLALQLCIVKVLLKTELETLAICFFFNSCLDLIMKSIIGLDYGS